MGLSLIWGSSFLLMAIGLDAFHPGVVTWMRIGFGSLVISALPQARSTTIEAEDRNPLRLLSVVWIALPLTLFPLAQQWIDSAVAGMLNGATPIFTAVLATFLLRTLPGRRQLTGLLIGFVGIVSIALPSAGASTTATIGVVMVVVATIGYAVSLNVVTPLAQKYGSLPIMARILRLGALLVTPYGIYGLTQSSFAWPSLLAMLAVGVLGTGFAFYMMGALTSSVGATRSAFITYAIPVVALALGVAFRDEMVSPIAIGGVALVIVGALLASRREG